MPITLLAGGTGFIGTRLADMLLQQGHVVRLLTRQPKGAGQFAWDVEKGTIDRKALEGVDYVVNLAGAGIADKRWTEARKREIVDSRVKSTHMLAEAVKQSGHQPQAWVSASAIGYYGNSGEQKMHETDAPVDRSFMVDCCEQWEQAVDEIAALGIRTVKLRLGVVLEKGGGALDEFVKPLRFGLGTYFGNGQAWYSWIHRDDVCRAFIWALETPDVDGVFNLVAPYPIRNKALVKAIAHARRRPAVFLPVPSFALRLLFGEMSATILNSNLIASEKIEQAGFIFQYPDTDKALESIFQK
ncbi:MAG TPA: TIGR01777 family oxidoreductase [Saprospiraceae bacterium]|nr:TIGR01777 family oxidoreductase [Saprospiraceae bacterium]HPI08020.1 TIGR01777 family oxidoreductase [Saprospiraceae bacterium]